ncbi:MAG: HAD family acid phosphatase [Caldivirga sp.]|jgi:beta-phosphoglucomutase-like phosphatase (HAD superfamily)|nr:MAG: phosphatase [Caldivirga sp. MG_3]NAZ28710.1 phosphatase [Caldivirga sp.]
MIYISFDIDGTLVDSTRRLRLCSNGNHVDWECFLDCGKLHLDSPIVNSIDYVNSLIERGLGIILLTGRPERMRGCTIRQLEGYGLVGFMELFMRPNDNHDPDPVYKSQAMLRILAKYPVLVHFDDNPDTVKALRETGIDSVLV